MVSHRRELGEPTVDFSEALKERFRNAGIDEVAVSVGSIDVPRGHLAVVLTLSSPKSSPSKWLKAKCIVNEECVKYLQDKRKASK